MRYLDGPRPRLFAHRGAAGEAPENTLVAFAAGIAAGADRLELDVHATRDGEVVVIHDATLERTTDGSGDVKSLLLAELQRLDAGYHFTDAAGGHPYRGRGIRVPTLAELLAEFPEVPLNIEIKQDDPSIEAAVLAVLDRFDARSRTLLAAEEASIMARIRAATQDVVTSFSAHEVAELVGRHRARDFDGYRPAGIALQIPPSFGDVELITAETVETAHRLGLEVHAWTINDESEMESLLALGVDGIMSDFPGRAAGVLKRLGLR